MLTKLKSAKLKKSDQGFTIIEVMIVLAIAGLILLIVFLAIPALQRSSRNTQRKADVSNLIGAVNNYVSNNNGTLPVGAAFATAFPDVAAMSYYSTAANLTWVNNGAVAPGTATVDPGSVDKVTVASFMRCNANGTAAVVGTSQRSIAAVYDIETSGTFTEQCISS